MRAGWTKTDHRTYTHASGRARVQYAPAERGRCAAHYTAQVDGQWLLAYPNRWIKPFRTLDAALDAAEKRLRQNGGL